MRSQFVIVNREGVETGKGSDSLFEALQKAGRIKFYNEQKKTLKDLIDRSSVKEVLGALRDICWEKGEHIRTSWQDEDLATCWDRTGNLLGTTTIKLERYAAPGITKDKTPMVSSSSV